MEQKRVGIWIRVSTDFQVKDESPEHHEQRARYYAKSRDWEVIEVYRLDAISGKTVMDHPETQRMLEDIRRGHITGLLFSKLARLARNTRELLDFAEIFRKENADLISLAEQIDTSTPAGRLFFTIISAMAQWEREEISSRVAASVPIRAEMGKPLGGQASFGYKWENKQLVIDSKEAPVRKLVYEIFRECKRKKTTANRLNDLGYRTRNGSRFSDTTIDRLIRDTTAKGIRIANYTKSLGEGKTWKFKPKEEWVQLPCEAIVSEEIWNECNGVLEQRKITRSNVGRTSEYLLAGLVRCHCGTPMYVKKWVTKYICSKCRNSIKETELYELYEKHLEAYLSGINPKVFISELEKGIKMQEELLISSIRRKTKLYKKMDDWVELRIGKEIDKEHFAKKYKPLEIQVNELEKSIPNIEALIDLKKVQLRNSDHILREAKLLYLKWAEMEFAQKRSIVEFVTENITVFAGRVDIALANLQSNFATSQQNYIPALPCLRFESKTLKLMHISYPEYPKTIGDHIKKKRMDLKLLQKDVAKIFNVSEGCITYWENNRSSPLIQYYPNVIKFLGYCPLEFNLDTFKGRIMAYRYLNGLSRKNFAKKMGVDPQTVAGWENDRGKGPKKVKVERLLAHYDFNLCLPH